MIRVDNWTYEDDFVLAETVLNHIRNGSTQLNAFEEVASILKRTSAACGFRWNSAVRKQYDEQIKLEKTTRKMNKKKNWSIPDINPELPETQKDTNLLSQATELVAKLIEQLEKLKQENRLLKDQLKAKPDTSVSEDFKNLLKIVEKARTLGFADKIS